MTTGALTWLTCVGVFIEISICTWALVISYSDRPWLAPLLLLAFHLGYLMRRPLASRIPTRWIAPCMTGATLVLAAAVASHRILVCLVALMLVSAVMQVARSALKTQGRLTSTVNMRAKLIGMLAAGVVAAGTAPFVGTLVVAAIAMLWLRLPSADAQRGAGPPTLKAIAGSRHLLWFEFFHHAHYFAYCYIFWLLLGSPWILWTGALFPLGWIGYWILDFYASGPRSFDARVLAAGHFVCAVAVAGMLSTSSPPLLLVLWVVTGFAGGTAYFLGKTPSAGNRELFEDYGHVAGCAVSASLAYITASVGLSISAAAMFALLATFSALI